jgi:hypothetical protein
MPALVKALPSLAAIDAELARRGLRASASPLTLYRDDPVAFVHDCLRWDTDQPTPYQEEILAALVQYRRVAVRGPHGLGKTAMAAWVILWFALTRDAAAVDWKAPTTASAWRQLTQFLWPEVHKWARRLRWDRIGRPAFDPRHELLDRSLKLATGEAFAVASDIPDKIEGAHADALLYVFDEAKAIAPAIFESAEGAFAGAGQDTPREAYALCISTPGAPIGRFHAIHARAPGTEEWWTRHVTLEETIMAGRLSREWAVARGAEWGETSAAYQQRVLGEFAADEAVGVIPMAWVRAAMLRGASVPIPTIETLTHLGVDVARGGEDLSVLALRHGETIAPLRVYGGEATIMPLTGRVLGLLEAAPLAQALIDVIGLGAGVVDRLREIGQRVIAFNAAARCERRDRSGELGFVNLRSAAWWAMRERLDPEHDSRVILPEDPDLYAELIAPTWRITSSGQIEVEGKDTIRTRLHRSTDRADAVVMAYADGLLTSGPRAAVRFF